MLDYEKVQTRLDLSMAYLAGRRWDTQRGGMIVRNVSPKITFKHQNFIDASKFQYLFLQYYRFRYFQIPLWCFKI
jgi:hypothetical protein